LSPRPRHRQDARHAPHPTMIQRLSPSLMPRDDRRHRVALITASRTIEARIETVFAFLSDRRNHHKLTSRKVQLINSSDGRGENWHALMQLRGPLGLRRRVIA